MRYKNPTPNPSPQAMRGNKGAKMYLIRAETAVMNHEGAKDTKEEGRRKRMVGQLAFKFTRLFLVKMQGL
jgi:hypothetical protein